MSHLFALDALRAVPTLLPRAKEHARQKNPPFIDRPAPVAY